MIKVSGIKWGKLVTNIFSDVFLSSIQKINPGLSISEAKQALDEISLVLENEDLGRAFYKKLINKSGVRLIDYENFDQNTFQVVTELTYKNGEDEFRPDITLLVNGMPLVFIEVKKPNNRDGIIAEHKRIQSRFSNKKFRNFANVTQLMIFSNNMEYDESSSHKVEGAFYASSSYNITFFNLLYCTFQWLIDCLKHINHVVTAYDYFTVHFVNILVHIALGLLPFDLVSNVLLSQLQKRRVHKAYRIALNPDCIQRCV